MTIIAIVGSRNYPDLPAVQRFVASLDPVTTTIISGGARGVDSTAIAEARKLGFPDDQLVEIPALWHVYGVPNAAHRRNQVIAETCDRLVAFWFQRSAGTADVIRRATLLNRPILVYEYQPLDDLIADVRARAPWAYPDKE